MKIPARPVPSPALDQQAQEITDYDDGDPFACMAAGSAEVTRRKVAGAKMVELLKRVESCYEDPGELESLLQEDPASVKTVLYDIWYNGRFITNSQSSKADWAAEQSAKIGNATLLDYDREQNS